MRRLREFSAFLNENKSECYDDKENPFKYTESYLREDFHQSILDIGYCWWQNNQVGSYAEMIEKMKNDFGKEFALLILLGKYNQQIGNGGHIQYFDNGYASAGGRGAFSNKEDTELHENMEEWFKDVGLDKTELGEKIYRVIIESGEIFEKMTEGDEYCDECRGQGYEEETCYECSGSGEIESYDEDEDSEECPECGGSGRIEQMCSYCDGSGQINMGEYYSRDLDKLDDLYYTVEGWEKSMNDYARKVMFEKFPQDGKDFEVWVASRKYNL